MDSGFRLLFTVEGITQFASRVNLQISLRVIRYLRKRKARRDHQFLHRALQADLTTLRWFNLPRLGHIHLTIRRLNGVHQISELCIARTLFHILLLHSNRVGAILFFLNFLLRLLLLNNLQVVHSGLVNVWHWLLFPLLHDWVQFLLLNVWKVLNQV